jgi:hypothetical protein
MTLDTNYMESCNEWVDRVESMIGSATAPATVADLRRIAATAFADNRIRVVVCGEWNSGKSALINALVEQRGLLPVDALPCSSYVTEISRQPQSAFAVVRHGDPADGSSVSHEDFLKLTAQAQRDMSVRLLRTCGPFLWPNGDFLIVDTPGLADVTQANSDVTLKYLPEADVIVLVLQASQGVTATMGRFVHTMLRSSELRRVVCVLSRADNLNEVSDVDRVLSRCKATLESSIPKAPWHAVANPYHIDDVKREDFSAYTDPAIAGLRESIAAVVRRERGQLLLRRFSLPAKQRLADIEGQLQAEESSLAVPLAEADRRLQEFRRNVAETARHNAEVLRKAERKIADHMEPWLRSIPSQIQGVKEAALKKVEGLSELEALRDYVNTDSLGRDIAQQLRRLGTELEAQLAEAVAAVERDLLNGESGTGLAAPTISIDAAAGMPPVETIFKHIPEIVIQVLEALLLNPALPGGWFVALLARFGLDKLMVAVRKLPFFGQFLPTQLARTQLQNAVVDSLDQFATACPQRLRDTAEAAARAVVAEVQVVLERRIAAVEAGLEDAKLKRGETQAEVESRRAHLRGLREGLGRMGEELGNLGK